MSAGSVVVTQASSSRSPAANSALRSSPLLVSARASRTWGIRRRAALWSETNASRFGPGELPRQLPGDLPPAPRRPVAAEGLGERRAVAVGLAPLRQQVGGGDLGVQRVGAFGEDFGDRRVRRFVLPRPAQHLRQPQLHPPGGGLGGDVGRQETVLAKVRQRGPQGVRGFFVEPRGPRRPVGQRGGEAGVGLRHPEPAAVGLPAQPGDLAEELLEPRQRLLPLRAGRQGGQLLLDLLAEGNERPRVPAVADGFERPHGVHRRPDLLQPDLRPQ